MHATFTNNKRPTNDKFMLASCSEIIKTVHDAVMLTSPIVFDESKHSSNDTTWTSLRINRMPAQVSVASSCNVNTKINIDTDNKHVIRY